MSRSAAAKTPARRTTQTARPDGKPAQAGNAPAQRRIESADDGKTRVEQEGKSVPRLPHEHDQSSDSQRSKESTPPRVGKQALKDVERGLVDTDRGLVPDRADDGKVKR